jgi:hypothetical protein
MKNKDEPQAKAKPRKGKQATNNLPLRAIKDDRICD